jgi:diaminopimelate decarboxylase
MNINSIKQALERNETPFYHYDMTLLNKTLQYIKKESEQYSYQVHYALKANSDNRILKMIKEYNLGADCVSGNEISKAVEIGFESNKIVFAGVGKQIKK